MRVSIKVLVGALLLAASLGAMVCALLPSIVNLQDDAMQFVMDASNSAADQVSFVLTAKLRMVRKFGNVLHQAASRSDMLDRLQPWRWVGWAANVVVAQDLSLNLFRSDDRGFILSPYSTILTVNAQPVPGYVYITNFTLPGVYLDSGFFRVAMPHTGLNTTAPWTRTNSTILFSTQTIAKKIANISLTAPMQWVSLSPRTGDGGIISTILAFGGHVNCTAATSAANRRQVITANIRGETLVQYFQTVNVSSTGVAVLVDTASGAYVAGGLSDPTGVFVNGTPQLILVSQLQDPRIATILHSSTADYHSGLDAVMTCPTPCSFTYWPHSHQLINGGTDALHHGGYMNVLFYEFTSLSVVQVSEEIGGALDLRLIVAIPSSDVIGGFMFWFRLSILWPILVMVLLCGVLVVGVWWLLREFSVVEAEMIRISTALNIHSTGAGGAAPCSPSTTSEMQLRGLKMNMFSEFRRIVSAVMLLARELYTLRAFSAVGPAFGSHLTGGLTSSMETSNNGGLLEARSMISHRSSSNPTSSATEAASNSPAGGIARDADEQSLRIGVPYQPLSGKLWRVPVTSIYASLGNDYIVVRDDPVVVFERHLRVLNILQQLLLQFSGTAVDHFYGDRFIMHLNAIGRTPKHVLAAISFVKNALTLLRRSTQSSMSRPTNATTEQSPAPHSPPVVFFSISSNLALCGLMGPPSLRSFTVVSPGEAQAAVMCHMAMALNVPVLLTWRAVEVAIQDQRRLVAMRGTGSTNGPQLPTDGMPQPFQFRVVATVYLPGESMVHPSSAFTLS